MTRTPRIVLSLALAAGMTLPMPVAAATHGAVTQGRSGSAGHTQSAGRASSSGRSRSSSRKPQPPQTLAQALQARLRRAPFYAKGVGVTVISLKDGRTIFESKGDQTLMPASTMKVLTSAAALEKLGPSWTYKTPFLTDAPPVDGVVAGNLYVKGVCAPDLTVEKFQEMAEGLHAAGVRQIQGDIVGDLLYFDGEERPPEWPSGGRPNPYAAPISALAPNFSTVRVTVTPADRPGAPADVVVEPPSEAVPISGAVRTVKGRSTLSATRRLERVGGDSVGNRIVVGGRISYLSSPWEKYVPIEDPAGVAISAVKHALQQAGIVVMGTSRIGSAPETAAPVYTLPSKPLAEIVQDMNKNSNNFIAEMLLRTLGAESFGPPASRDKGTKAVAAFLRSCGVDPSDVTLTDGSGLSRSNLLTANTLARVLVRMWGDPNFGQAFFDSLPIGGVDGTLRGRMFDIEGRVHAKTGTIDGVSTLAGYVEDTSEGPVAFAFLINGASHHRAVRGLDDLCRILCAPRPVPMSAAATTEARTADTSPTSSARSN